MPYDNGPLTDGQPKPGFFGGLLNSLFPTSGYGDLIDPAQAQAEQKLALRRAGLMLLAGAGPRPYGTRNVGGDIAAALDPENWQHRLAAVAEQSATIGQMQRKAQLESKAQAIMSQFPPVAGETDQQRDTRLSNLANAFQQAGLMDQAKAASDLRSSLRAPALTRGPNGELIDHWGNVVGTAPGADAGVEGSQLYTTATQRLRQFDDIHAAVLVLNRARNAPAMAGHKLDPVTSATLMSAAQAILQTHSALAQDEDNPLKALAHAHSAGDLGKFLAAVLSQGGGSLTTEQRDQILKLVDPVLSDLNAEQTRVKDDIHDIFRKRWPNNPAMAEAMWNQLPSYADFSSGARVVEPGVDQGSVKRINRALGRPND